MQTAIDAYYRDLKEYAGLDVTRETSIRGAMFKLLSEAGREKGWVFVTEHHLPNGKIPDGAFLDAFAIACGYWEAKDTKDDLETEIKKKFALNYPAENIVFEDTRRAVLFQGRQNRFDYDLTKPEELRELLRRMTAYEEPHHEFFKQAMNEFAAKLPELAKGIKEIITAEQSGNRAFIAAFAQFHEMCKAALNPQISAETIEEMLVQHLLTERLFRTIFENPGFTRRNVIAAEIEKVIDALASQSFSRDGFMKRLDRYYNAIETQGKTITDWNEKQQFLNSVYERFFQGFSTKQADTHGIVYTPQPIVNFMLASVEHLLKTEFGSSLSDAGVNVLDPCTGTGNYIVNLMRHHLSRRALERKYASELFANEIMLLPYYIASLNIEHAYYELTKEYRAFEGLCFADTLTLAEGSQMALFAEANSERTEREKEAAITVIIGNPPYNVGQVNENDNNKNRAYEIVDKKVSATYAKASKATNRNSLSDAYVKFFRWATDRLNGQDGIVCFVSNNGFLNGIATDGMRKCLAEDFTHIYHLDLGGNVRKDGGGNVFGIRVGVGITILARLRQKQDAPAVSKARIFYHAQENTLRPNEKLELLTKWESIKNVAWQELTPDAKQSWITEGLDADFDAFLSIGTKEGKATKGETETIFKTYGRCILTCRDNVVYDFDRTALIPRVQTFISDYNSEIDRWIRDGRPKDIDNFVRYDSIDWSRDLKADLKRERAAEYSEKKVRLALYRPFCKRYLFFDSVLCQDIFPIPIFLPTPGSEKENTVLVVSDHGHRSPFSVLATNHIPDLHLLASSDAFQCFPFYVYDEDGTNRRENITDWALQQFQAAHGPDVTKWDIFHYVYALLHSPAYRTRYAENLKRELPRIPPNPPAPFPDAFASLTGNGERVGDWKGESMPPPSLAMRSERPGPGAGGLGHYAAIGAKLLALHRDYEDAPEYKLTTIENRDEAFSWRVERMRLSKDKTQIIVNPSLTLAAIPPDCFQYRLGNRSALEWILDQYQVTTDKRSGLVSDPNRDDDRNYIVSLIGKVIAVSLETVRLVGELEGNLGHKEE